MDDAEEAEKARRGIPALLQYARALDEIQASVAGKVFDYKTDDHSAFLAIAIGFKQAYHMRSVLALVVAGQSHDAVAIGRLMTEAMAIEHWAKGDQNRAKQWRLFALVLDYQLLQERNAKGEVTAPEVADKIRDRALTEASAFLTKKATDAIERGQPLPERPFVTHWMSDGGVTGAKALFLPAELASLYDFYSASSDWIHTGTRGIARILRRAGNRVTFEPYSHEASVAALAAATAALAYSLDTLNDRLALGLEERLRELREEVHRILESVGQRPASPAGEVQ